MGALPAGGVVLRFRRAAHVGHIRCRLLCRSQRRHAGHARNRARQGGIQAGRYHDGRRHGAHRRTGDSQCLWRPSARHQHGRGQDRADAHSGQRRPRLGFERLCGRDLAPAARRTGAADAGPRHRRAMVRDRPQGAHARAGYEAAGADSPEHDLARSLQGGRACSQRGGAHRRRRRRCRYSQPDQLQAAGSRRLLSRPAPPDRRGPRPLRPTDRRNAGHARADPLGRRRRGGRAQWLSAHATAARALFRRRHRAARTAARRSPSRCRPSPEASA